MVYWPISAAFKWQSRRGGPARGPHAGRPKVTQSHKLPARSVQPNVNTQTRTQTQTQLTTWQGAQTKMSLANWKRKRRKSIDGPVESILDETQSRCVVQGLGSPKTGQASVGTLEGPGNGWFVTRPPRHALNNHRHMCTEKTLPSYQIRTSWVVMTFFYSKVLKIRW